MIFSGIFSKKNSIVGIDIGTSFIKIAQVTQGAQPFLDTYGIVNSSFQLGGKNDESVIAHLAEILKQLLNKAGVTTNRCMISFPNSSVFTSVIELPKMSQNELNSAVEFEAKKYVPLALSEIDLSWTIISEGQAAAATTEKILLTAAPKQLTQNYQKVLAMAGLVPDAGEIEALALIRSLIGKEALNCVIIDIGSKSTGINIIENGFLRLSRNLNIGGETITNKIAQTLNVSILRAEQFKKDFGVSGTSFIPDTIKPTLNIIKNEVRQFLTIYQAQNIKVNKIILVGGGANLPGITTFFEDLKIPVELGNPLKAVSYSQNLEPIFKRYSLSLPVAIGLALRDVK